MTSVRATSARAAAVERPVGSATETAVIKPASPAVTVAPAYEATPIKAGPAIVVGPSIETGPPIKAVVPRAGADEDSAVEPVRTIVAVGGAGIRGIPVIAIRADRRNIAITSANSNGNPNLRLRRSRRRKHANRQ